MSRLLRVLVIVCVLSLIAIAWFWWNQPKRVDMAAYVPADALVYIEANSLTDIGDAITETDIWQRLDVYLDIKPGRRQNGWLTYLIKTTGIGSTPAVITTRAQIAFVILDLGATSKGDTLEVKLVAALVVETHTSATRIKPVVEKLLGDFANHTYLHPKLERINLDEGELVRWVAPDGQRQIVASFDGSVVVVGNNDQAVSACLAARRGKRPSLLHQPELEETRSRLHANDALAFGYVSSDSSPQLAAQVAPIALGRLFEGAQVQQLVVAACSKILGNMGWSARSFHGGIEDSYFLALKPGIATRLRSALESTNGGFHGAWEFLPRDVYSVTTYSLRDPAGAWESLNAAMSSQLDTLSAVIFTAGFKSLLAPYGIEDPDTFLRAIKPDVVTVRLTAHSEQALVLAGIADASVLHQFVAKRFGSKPRMERIGDTELVLSTDEQYAASFAGDYFILGAPEDLRACLTARAAKATIASTPAKLSAVARYREEPNSSSVVTYAKDDENARGFLASLAILRGTGAGTGSTEIDRIINDLPYASTETAVGEGGFERRSRSAFGLFGYLVSLLAPETGSPARK